MMAVKIKLRAQRIMRKLKLKGWIVFMCFSSSLWLKYYFNFIFIENECNNLINCNWVANMNNLETKNGRLKAHLGAWIKFFFFFGCIRKFKPNYFLLKLILGEVNNLRKNVTDKVFFVPLTMFLPFFWDEEGLQGFVYFSGYYCD
jgi:hypothetical protein